VRRGRKATGLEKKMAVLPKDDMFGLRGFCVYTVNFDSLITV
jgi:hypothetical protein